MGKRYERLAMARPLHRLTAVKVARAKKPGMYADGGSLYMRIASGGSKQYVFRYIRGGRLHDMGIGPTHTISLAEARERATEARKLLLDGIDPLAAKRARLAALRAAEAKAMTFADCVKGFLRDNEGSWTSPKHRKEWEASLIKYAFPVLGALPVAAIDTPLVLRVLKPIWATKPDTASRVRGRIESALAWATVHHYRAGDNPARWNGLLEHALPAVVKDEHHAALAYTEVPAFVAKLRQRTASVPAKCLEFIVLTAVRLGEARGATWGEIDLNNHVWTIPAGRMKTGKEHRVPLSMAALGVLADMHEIRRSAYVFPGTHDAKPIGKNAPWFLLREMGGAITIHGFRSSFRDWAAERTTFAREVAEMALAHAIPDAVEAAYRRGDLFDKRRKLMAAWATYCAKVETGAGKVVALARARTPQ
jgi:integrase